MSTADPLEGGATSWRAMLRDIPALPVMMVTVAAHMALFGMLTPVMALYAQSFGVGDWQIGLMITVFAAGRLAADIPAGHAASRVGLRVLLWGGALLCTLGSVVGAVAADYPTLLAGRTAQGVGSGLYMTAATIFCAQSSHRRNRGKVMALFQGAMLVGAAMGPTIGGLSAAAFGFAGPFYVAAGIGAATTAVAFLGFRDPETGVQADRPHLGGVSLFVLPFVCVLLVNFAIFLTRTAGQWQMIPLLAAERFALGPEQLGVAISLSALATLAVLPVSAHLVDTRPRGPIIVVSLFVTTLMLVAIVLAPSAAVLYAAMIGMGISTGIGGPAVAAFAVDVVPPDRHGPAMGVMRFAGDLGYLIGPLSLGALVDLTAVGHGGALAVNAGLLTLFAVLFGIFATGRHARSTSPPHPKGERAMSERIWDAYLTERDKQVFAASGFGAHAEWGQRPALLVIDVNYAFCDEKPVPILESIRKWRTSCGEDAWEAMPVLARLIEVCRGKGIPVIYTTGTRRPDNWDSGSWSWKNSRRSEDVATADSAGIDGNEIVAEIAPGPRDLVVLKQKPSGFAGTPLHSYLQLLGCDSVIVTGTTTSGCVRATVLDAFSLNFRCTVVEDGCFDRSQASHAINLCDMHAKYANVLPSAEVVEYLHGLSQGMFDLPSGQGMAIAAE